MQLSRFLTILTTATAMAIGWGAIAPSPLPADMGHDHGHETATPAADSPHGHDHDRPAATEMPHGGDHRGHDGHSHGMMAIPEGEPVPEVTVEIFPDPVSGWNLQIQTANWAFAPESVNATSTTTEGHAHLYVNGEKVTRIYSEWYHIPDLPPGEHVLTVGLNANGHEALMHNGEPIEASVKVMVPGAISEER